MLANANGSRHQIIVRSGVNDDERGSVGSYHANDGRITPVSTSVDPISGEIDAVSDGSPQLWDVIEDVAHPGARSSSRIAVEGDVDVPSGRAGH